MTDTTQPAAWGFGLVAVALTIDFGPLVAGYVVAGIALAVVVGLMGTRVGRTIGDWCLEHRCPFHHGRARFQPGDERRAA